jgi:hypothetical protein
MNAPRIAFRCLAVAALAMAATFAQAQATRTWVSGTGDDANPCSRTAPCKTIPGAISKTAAHGEIDALDPGGYGTVTITKSITIDGGTGAGWASILNSGVPGVTINAGTTDVVTLRNLSINGAGTGTNGIRILSAGSVYVENCQIFGNVGTDPSGNGIIDTRTNPGGLTVLNTVIRNNGANGVSVNAAGVDVTLRNVSLTGNGSAGMQVTAGWATMTNSVAADNAGYGVNVNTAATLAFIGDSILSDNHIGFNIGPSPAVARLNNVVITNNDIGIQKLGGSLFTFSNNKIDGNTSGNSAPMTPVGLQ